ncbi:DUF2975 domain-containing protein [Tumidithrix helvetica PCC 7403]|uniref:hypothetical protein n=1 Tax=Tumidithrix helvetica TaxID=3457545 RepID=UPI003C9613E8
MPSATGYYFPSDPPYLLFILSLIAGLACGRAFESTLRELVQEWATRRTSRTLLQLKGSSIQIPYIGITLCVGVFLSSGLEIFGFPSGLAYSVAVPLTLGSAYFVWRQLGKMLVELERGGSAAMDLDMFEN